VPPRSRLLAPLTSALLGALVLGLLALVPAPAVAVVRLQDPHDKVGALAGHRREPSAVFRRSAYLCMGYQACRAAGMGNAGYASNNQKMYWRMYSGHNCTNYAAYRMVKSGLPNERPWSGGGNATYWGTSVPRITDGTPRIGAVAWWKANTGPAGSAGHVAYVEKVVSADEIVVSQDSWGGDFSWAVVTRSSGNWPSGFVHFNDRPLVNAEVPVVTGVAKVGSVLTSTPGTWRPAAVEVDYQWYGDGRPIEGADDPTLTLTRARLDQQVTVRTTASQLGYPTKSATSAPTERVQPGQLRNLTLPEISGAAKVDSSLTLSPGSWNPEPALSFQWLADGRPIQGATGTTLDLGPELVDQTITATITATREGYDAVAVTTAATEPVAPGTFTVTTRPSLHGTPELGETLTVRQGTFAPSDSRVDVEIQWLRDGEPVLNATGPSYQITNVDLGSRVSALVTLSRAGYTATTVETERTPVLRTEPRMKVVTDSGVHRVRLAVTITAPGVTEVSGSLVVRMAGVAREVTLRNGVAKVVLKGVPAGKRTMTLRYSGSDTVNRLTTTRTVRIG
jgi:surface antigen